MKTKNGWQKMMRDMDSPYFDSPIKQAPLKKFNTDTLPLWITTLPIEIFETKKSDDTPLVVVKLNKTIKLTVIKSLFQHFRKSTSCAIWWDDAPIKQIRKLWAHKIPFITNKQYCLDDRGQW